jgi:histidine ammonia-lyase
MAIALTDLGNMSERRIAKLIDNHTEHYPSFLAARGGLNSGFMLLQYTAAASDLRKQNPGAPLHV